MNRSRLAAVLALVVLLAASLAWRAERPSTEAEFAEAEVARLRKHFAVVKRELLARDVSGLSAEQREARAGMVRRLGEYAAAGRFPKNDHFPGERVPYFRDAHGTLCAMAYLLDATGQGRLVDRVAGTRNNAYLPDLADEPGLSGWLDAQGLTLAEAARIQPTYGQDEEISDGFAAVSMGLGVLNGAAIILNLQGGSREALIGRGFFGIVAGGVSMGVGLSNADRSGAGLTLAVTEFLAGAASAALGTTSLIRSQRKRESSRRPGEPELTIQPVTREANGRPALGLSARLSF